jgi:hypothetical protein
MLIQITRLKMGSQRKMSYGNQTDERRLKSIVSGARNYSMTSSRTTTASLCHWWLIRGRPWRYLGRRDGGKFLLQRGQCIRFLCVGRGEGWRWYDTREGASLSAQIAVDNAERGDG